MSRNILRKAAETRLHGRGLVLAQFTWSVLALFLVGVAIASLPASFAALHQPCAFDVTDCNGQGLLTASQIQALPQLGLTLDIYAWSAIVTNGLVALILWVMGGILVFRRSDDWMVLLIALLFVGVGATDATNALSFSSSFWGMLENGVLAIQSLAILFTLALFPTGRFVPGFARWIALIYPAYIVCYLVFLNQLHLAGWLLFNNPVNAILWFGCWIVLTLAQLYRYFRVSTPIERQQTRWVAFAFFLLLAIGIVGYAATPTLHSFLHNGFLSLLLTNFPPFIGLFLPLSIGIAILRYRLYAIDRIINRTLVYGTLTASLALLYAGLILGLQILLRGVIQQTNTIALIVSTLVIAALFQPLRHRIQAVIDRSFYRRKYDVEKTLAAFNATLRNEVDLATLSKHVLAVVQETMQPTHVSLWLRSPVSHGPQESPPGITPAAPPEPEAREKPAPAEEQRGNGAYR